MLFRLQDLVSGIWNLESDRKSPSVSFLDIPCCLRPGDGERRTENGERLLPLHRAAGEAGDDGALGDQEGEHDRCCTDDGSCGQQAP